jgi:uncharacterized cupredoxin-like copper-binding protein
MKRLLIATWLAASAGFAVADAKHDHSKAEETAFGRAADPKQAKRTVRVEMTDQMRFVPGHISVTRGEALRFVPLNKGQEMHEMVLGTMDELRKHAEMMRKHPGMQHDEPHMVHVAPGKSGELAWQFTKAGEFFYACLIPGHFEAGMIGRVTVKEPAAQHHGYSGEEKRQVRALSDEEVKQYLSGAGMGYAKAAELNSFPGPMHVLELADKLKLTPEQHAVTRKLMEAHKAEASKIGARLVEAEQRLEALFRSGNVAQDTLAQAVARAAVVQGEYRLAHLETHRRMRALLSADQAARYDELRGYRSSGQRHKH